MKKLLTLIVAVVLISSSFALAEDDINPPTLEDLKSVSVITSFVELLRSIGIDVSRGSAVELECEMNGTCESGGFGRVAIGAGGDSSTTRWSSSLDRPGNTQTRDTDPTGGNNTAPGPVRDGITAGGGGDGAGAGSNDGGPGYGITRSSDADCPASLPLCKYPGGFVGSYCAPAGSTCVRGDGGNGDRDCDGVPDNRDNCTRTQNPSQSDEDRDGVGDACDQDWLIANQAPARDSSIVLSGNAVGSDAQLRWTGIAVYNCRGSWDTNNIPPNGDATIPISGPTTFSITCDKLVNGTPTTSNALLVDPSTGSSSSVVPGGRPGRPTPTPPPRPGQSGDSGSAPSTGSGTQSSPRPGGGGSNTVTGGRALWQNEYISLKSEIDVVRLAIQKINDAILIVAPTCTGVRPRLSPICLLKKEIAKLSGPLSSAAAGLERENATVLRILAANNQDLRRPVASIIASDYHKSLRKIVKSTTSRLQKTIIPLLVRAGLTITF